MRPESLRKIILSLALIITLSYQTNAQGCLPASNLYAEPLTFTSANFMWSAPSGTIAFYQVYIHVKGTASWEVHTVNYNAIKLFNLEPGFVYEWKVRTRCESASYVSKNNFSTINELYMPIQKLNEAMMTQPVLNLYPSPAMNDVTIQLSVPNVQSGIATIELVNIMGQIAQTQSLLFENGSINTTLELDKNINSGWYIFRISAGNKVYQKNLVVTR